MKDAYVKFSSVWCITAEKRSANGQTKRVRQTKAPKGSKCFYPRTAGLPQYLSQTKKVPGFLRKPLLKFAYKRKANTFKLFTRAKQKRRFKRALAGFLRIFYKIPGADFGIHIKIPLNAGRNQVRPVQKRIPLKKQADMGQIPRKHGLQAVYRAF